MQPSWEEFTNRAGVTDWEAFEDATEAWLRETPPRQRAIAPAAVASPTQERWWEALGQRPPSSLEPVPLPMRDDWTGEWA